MSAKNSLKMAAYVLLLASCPAATIVNCQQAKGRIDRADIEAFVDELRLYPWEGPKNFTSPLHWVFNLKEPMQKILNAGSPAEIVLLRHLADEGAKEQIVILLGGAGGVKSIEPIIDAMADEQEQKV